MIRIVAKRAGFRRAGIAHPDTATDYPDDRFSKQQLAVLEAEPMLVVQRLPDPKPSKKDGEQQPAA